MKKNAVSQSPATDLRVNEKKWSKALMDAGWTVVPSVIIERQQALGLDAIDINILMHLATYWWTKDNKPHPSKSTIAAAIGIHPRTVQRRIAEMEKGGLIRRQQRRVSGQGSKTNVYHLEGLIDGATQYAEEKLQEIARRAAERKAKSSRKGKARLHIVKDEE